MKINLRFLVLGVFVAILITDRGFNQLFFEREDDALLGKYYYLLVGFSLALSLLNLRYMSVGMRRWFFAVLTALGLLALESYQGWGSWMVYPHVFSKLTVLLHIFGAYAYYRRVGQPPFGPLVFLILLGLGINLAFFNSDSLSLNAFLNNERGFVTTSAYLFLVVGLLNLNWFLQRGHLLHVCLFFGCMAMIVFLQHRTVWVSTAVALPLNLLLLRRVPGVRFSPQRLLVLGLLPVLVGGVGGVAAILDNPNVIKRLEASIEDIQNPDKQGTGSWRMKQYEAYEPVLRERPVLGWRLDGFELPVQFYSDDTDAPIWENFTGHHFHSFYLDRLFYFGIVGVLLVLLMPIYVVAKRLLQPGPIPAATAALMACCATLVVYAISYDWPAYYYALVGLMLAGVQASAPVPVAAPARRPLAHTLTSPEPAPSALTY
ncbi:O-antigen ligase family protein [Hymenobacter edaphi]|uniref:O-antigen ligase-related domain-containing protein n=1 Tax=Hymenobacter edaphi TaxID=2211146 RepID=A0A328BQM5_9BACT|nr:O-antigen ligase family protein [Hymenobacter edaphi]RAK69377.1 hypothetical protein DLM85_00490 [Hymenobacter edaphi]